MLAKHSRGKKRKRKKGAVPVPFAHQKKSPSCLPLTPCPIAHYQVAALLPQFLEAVAAAYGSEGQLEDETRVRLQLQHYFWTFFSRVISYTPSRAVSHYLLNSQV